MQFKEALLRNSSTDKNPVFIRIFVFSSYKLQISFAQPNIELQIVQKYFHKISKLFK